jgi:hypothetical protein
MIWALTLGAFGLGYAWLKMRRKRKSNTIGA